MKCQVLFTKIIKKKKMCPRNWDTYQIFKVEKAENPENIVSYLYSDFIKSSVFSDALNKFWESTLFIRGPLKSK